MPLRFSRRLSLVPGLRVNLSKSGASVSVGHRGGWWTIGPRGQRATVGLPGIVLVVLVVALLARGLIAAAP